MKKIGKNLSPSAMEPMIPDASPRRHLVDLVAGFIDFPIEVIDDWLSRLYLK